MDISGGYDSFVAEFYDHVVPYKERKDIDFYIELAQKTEGPILEIGCGTGRVLIPTAQAGKDILGFDASQLMLSVCRRRLCTEPEAVQHKILDLHCGDMRYFELHCKFSLITMPFRPFQHLITVEDQQACLANIHRHLEQNGYLAFDIMNPSLEHLIDDKYLNEFNEEPEMSLRDGRKISRRFCIRARNLTEQFIDAEIIYYVTHLSGRTERLVHSFPFRYTFKFELEHLLSRCGFLIHEVYSDFDKSPFGSKYPGELIIVARKC
ncbi:MAG TPA: class I SAM-dependent methyltransferase [Pyrinomonadaceae bacterium]|nr:class I SAM-dependent methyltransferase [Pyrinomonadaceae bacterium]